MSAPPKAERKIKLYDFRRPDKFSKDQTRVLQMIHESYARLTCTMLSAYLRMEVQVQVDAVDQCTYEEFLRSVPKPTVLARIDMDGMRGEAVLEIDPSLTYAMLDRLFGGVGADIGIRREITPIECQVLEDIITADLGNLREAWGGVADVRPRLGGIESNPQFAQVVPPNEMVVLVELKVRIGTVEGMMNLCLPYLTIQDVIPRLSQMAYYKAIRSSSSETPPPLAGLGVELDVSYDAEALSLSRLRALRPGSLVALSGYAEGKALLRAGSAPVCRLAARKPGRGPRRAWTVAERPALRLPSLLRGEVAKPEHERKAPSDPALIAMAADMVNGLKSLEGRVQELARVQAGLQDQLMLSPTEASDARPGSAPRRPFAFLTIDHCQLLAAYLAVEHPQLIALVLSRLEPALAACLLGHVDAEAQPDVVRRMATLTQVLPKTMEAVEHVVEKHVRVLGSQDYPVGGGVDTVAQLLGVAPRSLERHVVEALQATQPELAEEIKKRFFVFEDIVLLEDGHIERVLREVTDEDVVFALKATEDAVSARVWKCLGERQAPLKAAFARTGAARLVDADAAQQRIVAVVRRLEDEGHILIHRPGEDVVS